ncbi:hypothetical protein EI42_04825 [Thermosporothrix hazakensis]|jgi:hypothetical protein|uniref:Uncharacterized protein n=1 Tax=Thermosporothrix hazakensis TaxID=644383 RepID=A0A326U0F0_THEHA|nr:hypothetical protein [Thermosporothrix hazakensis]PZW23902.1 hypothetical protein EI42_04825 [Thermosporothrix hazakensis]GCE48500.1 hypothetical protein KTH_33690 [Thermosporothrix hazakensis]
MRVVKPLSEATAIYDVLSKLKVGDLVPACVYIRDYVDGQIPSWRVAHIIESPPSRRITVIDPDNVKEPTLWEEESWIALDIVALPSKVLATDLYCFTGKPHYTNMLGDIRQHGRKISDLFEEQGEDYV